MLCTPRYWSFAEIDVSALWVCGRASTSCLSASAFSQSSNSMKRMLVEMYTISEEANEYPWNTISDCIHSVIGHQPDQRAWVALLRQARTIPKASTSPSPVRFYKNLSIKGSHGFVNSSKSLWCTRECHRNLVLLLGMVLFSFGIDGNLQALSSSIGAVTGSFAQHGHP